MAPKEIKDRFSHRRANDPLADQQPGIGKQPYQRGDIEDKASLGTDNTTISENRKIDKKR
ncbi:hypothetical protein BH09BAC1_BH09BAC1_00600 [soil metagenome]